MSKLALTLWTEMSFYLSLSGSRGYRDLMPNFPSFLKIYFHIEFLINNVFIALRAFHGLLPLWFQMRNQLLILLRLLCMLLGVFLSRFSLYSWVLVSYYLLMDSVPSAIFQILTMLWFFSSACLGSQGQEEVQA